MDRTAIIQDPRFRRFIVRNSFQIFHRSNFVSDVSWFGSDLVSDVSSFGFRFRRFIVRISFQMFHCSDLVSDLVSDVSSLGSCFRRFIVRISFQTMLMVHRLSHTGRPLKGLRSLRIIISVCALTVSASIYLFSCCARKSQPVCHFLSFLKHCFGLI